MQNAKCKTKMQITSFLFLHSAFCILPSVSDQEVLVVVAADSRGEHVAGFAEEAAGLAVDAELHRRGVVAEQQQLFAKLDRHRFSRLHHPADDLPAVGDDAKVAAR